MQTPGCLMYINKGQDDEMQIFCFKTNRVKVLIMYLFTILTCGFLRLVLYWVPRWHVYATCDRCAVEKAEKILIKEVFLGKHTMYYVKALKVLTSDCIQTLDGANDEGRKDDLKLSVHFERGKFRKLDKVLMFTCKKVVYIWDNIKLEFVKLKGFDEGVAADILHFSQGLTSFEQLTRRLVYGPNTIAIKELPILTLIFIEVLNPFYVFQLASYTLWCLDRYYCFAAAIMIISIFGITMTVRQTRKNQRKLKSTVHASDVCTILRKHQDGAYSTESISTELLVPGDVIVVPAHGCVMHCDAVLLTGTCILNESMLTGESVPVTKTPLPNSPGLVYDEREHGRHMLFCGTHVIQTRYYGEERVLGVVVRTGFLTAKGGLVRSILYPPPVDFKFEKDSYKFIMLLAVIAMIGGVYTLIDKYMRGVTAFKLFIDSATLITIVVPPALPTAMTVGQFYAQTRLKEKYKIFCISPRAINVAGSIDCVCFDKTGTLTEDDLDLLCVAPIANQQFLPHIKQISLLPLDTLLFGLATCHSVTTIDRRVVGNPLDLKIFESTHWTMEEFDVADTSKFNIIFPTIFKPPNSDGVEIGLIREFPFSSGSQRMGVIVRRLGSPSFDYYLKGSPEMVSTFVKKETVPKDFAQVLETFTREGYRVIALAHRELNLSYAKVNTVQSDEIDKDLTLLGLIVLENRLKPETTGCIKTLNDANIRIIMVTGDNILTAVSVAKACDIVAVTQEVVTVSIDKEPPQLCYSVPDFKGENSDKHCIVNLDDNRYTFALTGKVWSAVKTHYPDLLPKLLTSTSIFARMLPTQKQELILELQNLGYNVAMCGDGANDCGALIAAHTGISLSEAEASVASPFTSANPNISCVVNVIREGRAALVTSFGIFKYMASYSLCQFISVLILYSIGSNLSNYQFLYIDLFIISSFAFFLGKTEAYTGRLAPETPLSSLISPSPVLSLILQTILIVFFQVVAFEHLKVQSWYEPLLARVDSDREECMENYVIFTISSFQYIILAVVFSKGKPYRKAVFSGRGFLLTTVCTVTFSVYLTLGSHQVFLDLLQLTLPHDVKFRIHILMFAIANFVTSYLVEVFVVDYLVFRKLELRRFRRRHLKRKGGDDLDTKWPNQGDNSVNRVTICQTDIVKTNEIVDNNHLVGDSVSVTISDNR